MPHAAPADLLSDPEFLPYRLDPVLARVLWLRMPAPARAGAAFLDERAIPPSPEGGWAPLASVMDPVRTGAARPADAIFHIGHCGSTLLSRLLESWNGLQVLREPMPLRTLADCWSQQGRSRARLSPAQLDALLAGLWERWSRPVAPRSRSLLKASSSCNALVAPLLRRFVDMRVILLDMPLPRYLATLLKAEGSVLDAASAAGERLEWLQRQGFAEGAALHDLGLPAQCAMGWLAEQLRFDGLARGAHAARVLRVDFEALLASPRAQLERIAAHLGLASDGVGDALESVAWGRYSKAPEHAYRADDRAHDLELAATRFAGEVAAGLDWVEAESRRHPELRDRLARARS